MKELTIEEKARRYDEALERARKEYKNHEAFKGYCEMLEHIFTELKEKESEDEKIRKWLITQLELKSDVNNPHDLELMILKSIAWLEKQGETTDVDPVFSYNNPVTKKQSEQKSSDKVEPKFKVGDFIVNNNSGGVYQITEIRYDEYCLWPLDGEIIGYLRIIDVDNEYHLWAIKDAKDGYMLFYKDEISIYKHDIKNCTKEGTNFGGFVYHCCYDGKRFITDSLYSLTEKDKKDIYPATKEQRDTLMKAMADAGYTFDFEKKELKKIENEIEIPFGAKDSELQEATYYIPKGFHAEIDGNKVIIKKGNQKPAWSKEDEEIYQSIIDDTVQENQLDNKQINWLKSLKSQKLCVYNPYKAVVESIAKMCDKYKNYMGDEKEAKDFLANVAVKCHEAAEYDKNYPQ